MEESFTLVIPFNGKEINQEFIFRKLGYNYKIFTTIDDVPIVFEPDEEGSFRATVGEFDGQKYGNAGAMSSRSRVDLQLLQAINDILTSTFKEG